MFDTLLIANRGEIACRIMRTAKRLGIRTVAVFSDADSNARHVREADAAVHVGPAPVAESYLKTDRIIAAAVDSGAQAIHPGYGFLSENAEFAEACAANGITFVGPPASAIRSMGLKDEAKRIMEDAGVPVVPGYHGRTQTPDFLRRKACDIGFPVLIKAVAGGGGKGMRRVDKAIEFEAALEAARREALSAFGNDHMLVEKYVSRPRHIEIQIFGDSHGNVVHLFERDCSLQRRHQKVIEEAPAPGMDEELRHEMGVAACNAARAVGYQGAGTVEFIADSEGGLSSDGFYFMEMNTRLQVEHPVSELITGQDLVEWQLCVAAGEPLPLDQSELSITGHAVEARVYAEDPANEFLPSTGRLERVCFPEGIRVDSGIEAGDAISPFYDPMIAKLISHGPDRQSALAGLQEALSATVIAGPKTNISFLIALCGERSFRQGRFDTHMIGDNLEALTAPAGDTRSLEAAGIEALIGLEQQKFNRSGNGHSPWSVNDAFTGGPHEPREYPYRLDGNPKIAALRYHDRGVCVLDDEGEPIAPADTVQLLEVKDKLFVLENGVQLVFEAGHAVIGTQDNGGGDGQIRVPMHGKIISVCVEDGNQVETGDLLFTVEAMKMEHAVIAPVEGVIRDCQLRVGEQMEEGALGLRIEALDSDSG